MASRNNKRFVNGAHEDLRSLSFHLELPSLCAALRCQSNRQDKCRPLASHFQGDLPSPGDQDDLFKKLRYSQNFTSSSFLWFREPRIVLSLTAGSFSPLLLISTGYFFPIQRLQSFLLLQGSYLAHSFLQTLSPP